MSEPLIYDFNNDGNITGADVVYFASNIAGISGFNIDNIDAETLDIDDLNITNMIIPITPPGTPPDSPVYNPASPLGTYADGTTLDDL